MKDIPIIEPAPRNRCRQYIKQNWGKEVKFIKKEEFDRHCFNNDFSDGPRKDTFGDGPGEPYNPNRQAFGTLKTGLIVYCELPILIPK